MTEAEFGKLLKTFGGLWPRWGMNPDRGGMLWSMFGGYEASVVSDAIRRAFHDEPDAGKPPLGRIRSLVAGGIRHGAAETRMQREIESHREHYAGWPGWKYPGDEAIRGYIQRGEPTPLQRHTFRAAAAAMKKAFRTASEAVSNV